MAEETKNPRADDELEELEGTASGADSGTADDKGTSSDEFDGNAGKGAGKGAGKTFTQEQVTRISAREKNQGRAAAFKELGIDPKDAKTVSLVKAFLESQKTDDQRIADRQAEDQSARVEAERRAAVAEAKAEAMMLGAKPQYVDDLVTLALAKTSDGSDLKTVIGEFKTKYPVWFGESDKTDDKDKGKTGQKGTGSSIKDAGKGKGGAEGTGLGARLAAQRKSGSKKASYWGKN